MPSVAMFTFSKDVFEQFAHALRRSKNLALHEEHWFADRCGAGSSTR
jgi:hypothetical protein